MWYADHHVWIQVKGSKDLKKKHFETRSIWWIWMLSSGYLFHYLQMLGKAETQLMLKTQFSWRKQKLWREEWVKNKKQPSSIQRKPLGEMWLWAFPHIYWASREGLWAMGFNLQQGNFACTLETGFSTIHTYIVEKFYYVNN